MAYECSEGKVQIARLRRQQFGRSSEKLDCQIEQLELVLEDLEAGAGADQAESADSTDTTPAAAEPGSRRPGGRRPLPTHLPRREVVHAGDCTCPACGGVLRKVGEDVTEILDYVPGRFEVIRHVRPAFSCRTCEGMVQPTHKRSAIAGRIIDLQQELDRLQADLFHIGAVLRLAALVPAVGDAALVAEAGLVLEPQVQPLARVGQLRVP